MVSSTRDSDDRDSLPALDLVLVAVGSKIIREGEQDWTGSLGMRGCLFCFPGYALNPVEGRLEYWDYQVVVERRSGKSDSPARLRENLKA